MTGTIASAQTLIDECQGLVRSLAVKIHRQLEGAFDLDDLVGYGQVGLAEAARSFSPAAGQRFTTFAYYRIRGSIYDGLGKLGWISRSQYRRLRCEALTNEVLEVDQRDPAPDATKEGQWFGQLARSLAVVYLATELDEANKVDLAVEDPRSPPPVAAAIARETSRILHELIDALPQDAGTLIRGLYFEGCSLSEMAQRLGVNKGWASRLHAKTLDRLARALSLVGVGDE